MGSFSIDLRLHHLFVRSPIKPPRNVYLPLLFCKGFPLRFVFAILRSSLSLIELAIWRDAALSDDLERLPRFADSAAPAAICCFFDFAGIHK
jgi:hypothetical protein